MENNQNPWIVLDSEVKYKNNWIEVIHRNVLNPSGGKGIYGTVHFKNIAVGIVPIDTNGHVYLVGQYRFPIESYSGKFQKVDALKEKKSWIVPKEN